MRIFRNAFFKSKDESTESAYQQGVRQLQARDHYAADNSFRNAAAAGHVSAMYNLFVLNGAGFISPYDIDFAADCLYKAAEAGHPSASKSIGNPPVFSGRQKWS